MDPGAGKAVILEFLRMLCGGDTAQHTCLLDWLTHAVQHPDAPGETALCVSGPPGCGKGQLWQVIRSLMQVHGDCVDMDIPVLRLWKADNGLLINEVACAHISECTRNEFKNLAFKLRALVRDNYLVRSRYLFQPPATIQVRVRIVVTTSVALDRIENDVQRDIERFTFIQCSNARVGDQAYFQALCAAIDDMGTVSAVCKFLRHQLLWARVRSFVRARAVVVYWLGLTEHLMAAGGAAEACDRMDYETDFM